MQAAFKHYITNKLDTIANQLNNITPKQYWYYSPQAWAGRDLSDADDGWQWRKPTQSEYSCVMYFGLCYGISGYALWKYDGIYHPYPQWENAYHSTGFIDLYDTSLTAVGYSHKNRVNPNIKAIDSTYLSITWDTAYAVPPNENLSNCLISSIRAVPNHPDSISPDTGWFHVGEYYDNAGMRYFMLVNRACSQGVDDPAEAGSITAIVELNRSALSNSTQLLVIDIADSITTDWVAVSETTYTSLYDDKLYFTTVLKAGEGRLFKVVDADNKDLNNNDNELYFTKQK